MIRIATTDDIPQILAIYGPYIEHSTASFEYTVPSEEAFRERFLGITRQFPWLVWEEEGRILGYAYASRPFGRAAYQWCAEDSVYLLPQAHGKGIGKKLLTALEKILTYQGYRVVYAIITSENERSLAFHRRCGYEFLAEMPHCGVKFDKSLGIVWMEKRLSSVEIPSNTPLSWPEIGQNERSFSDILDILSLS